MFRLIGIYFLCQVCLLSSASEERIYNCHYLTAAPVIDGRLEEAAWKPAAYSSDQFTDFKGKPARQTVFKVGYNSAGLFIGVKCTDNPDKVRQGDNIDIYVIPHGIPYHFHFIINPKGLKYFNLLGKYDYTGKYIYWESGIYYGKDYYSVELYIPWYSMLKIPQTNEQWKFNIGRAYTNKYYFSWSPLKGGEGYQPKDFGILAF
ncbi:MAG: hypothetical protein PHH77_11060 [Victivallaceae bacterium]|nr:hypothetical protein [Victivallaceae bacterium]